MAEKAEQSPISNPKDQPKLCEECNTNASKYKCPGCSLRTCSLPCVNSHKKRTSCTGKKSLSDVVPISQFDDNLLLSDYNMLEEVKRMAEAAQRTRAKLCGYTHFRLPFPLKSLRNAAASRRTKLLFLSDGMSKRQANKTYYNNRKKFISWTIEWRFHSTDVVLVNHGVQENTTLSSVIQDHLKPGPWNHSLKQFCDEPLDSLKFFIRKYPKGPKSPYRQLNIKAPIREQLANIVIMEFPVIHVFLPSHSVDFEVLDDNIPKKVEIKEPSHCNYPSQKGVTFREEEVEDAGSSDPLISDLTKHSYPINESEKGPKELLDSPSPFKGVKWAKIVSQTGAHIRAAEDNNTVSCIDELAAIADMDFDFETGIMDVYSDLMSDTNPDDFLNFDGLLPEHKDLDGGGFLLEEELEEGEIVEN